MRRRILAAASTLLSLGLTLASASADDGEPPVRMASQPTVTPSPGPGDDATLPPVVVRPEDDAPPQNFTPRAPTQSPFDLPLSYPSLREETFSGLNGVTRNGRSLFDTPSFGSIIGQSLMDQRTPSDMARTLQTEVGILMQTTGRGQASPFVRALTGQQILVLVDGVRLNNSTFRAGPNQYFNLIDPGQVDRVEVLRGTQGVLWGSDAIGGVINVVTRTADHNRGNYAGGSAREFFGTADASSYTRANVESALGNGSIFAGASYMNVNDLTRGGGQGRQPFTNYDQYAADVKYQLFLDDDTLVTFAGQHFVQNDLPRSDRFLPFVLGPPLQTRQDTWFTLQQRDLFYTRVEGLSDSMVFDVYTFTLSFQNNQEATEQRRFTNNVQVAPPNYDLSKFDVRSLGYTMVFAKELDWAGRLTYGADWYYDDVDATRRRITTATGLPVAAQPAPQFPDDSLYERLGAFINWDLPVTDRIDFIFGTRYENARAQGTPRINNANTFIKRAYSGWVGSGAIVFKATENLNLIGNVSQGYRAPNLDDLFADVTFLQNLQTAPTVDVRPEYPINYEVGFKYDAPRFRLQVVEFWMDLRSNVTRIPVGANTTRINSHAYVTGTEINGEYLLTDTWSVYGNFWNMYGQDLDRNEPFARVPPTQGILGLRWRDTDGRRWLEFYSWMVDRQDRYAFLNLSDARFPAGGTAAYATFNVRAGTTMGQYNSHRLTLNLENLSNTPYRVLGSGVDGAGINGLLGYEYVR